MFFFSFSFLVKIRIKEYMMASRLHSGYAHPVSRIWQSINSTLRPENLMYPLFIIDDPDEEQEIKAMPGVSRLGVNKVMALLEKLVPLGLNSVLLFSVTSLPKDETGSSALSPKNPVYETIRRIKARFGDKLLVAVDICLCPYSTSGHCGVFDPNGEINNEKSIEILAEMSAKIALEGADIVAPSDMMDGRVKAIKAKLKKVGLEGKVAVLSYSTKFASSFYGPFREAAHSAPQFGDRKRYQLPAGSQGLGVRASDRDVQEGADMLMVKPGLSYLDMVRQIKDRHPHHPMFVYQVSGEYAMLIHGSDKGAFNKKSIILEVMASFRRAGADVIISYFTPLLLEWLNEKRMK